jgi:hypothetical protein
VLLVLFVSFISSPLIAQDFGFGDEADASGAAGGSALAVDVGGEVSAVMTGFFDDFGDGADAVRLGVCRASTWKPFIIEIFAVFTAKIYTANSESSLKRLANHQNLHRRILSPTGC